MGNVDFVGDRPWDFIRRDLERKRRAPVTAVVSYIGINAPTILKLRKGDSLVCDASERSIKYGSTNAEALQSYRRKGVRVFSVADLHAKVISSPSYAWVGSANASDHSYALLEASVRLSGPDAKSIHSWTNQKRKDATELTPQEIATLCEIKVIQTGRAPEARPTTLVLPDKLTQLVLMHLSEPATAAMKKQAAAERPSVSRLVAAPADDSIQWFIWDEPKVPLFKEGAWVMRFHGSWWWVAPPAKILRVTDHGNYSIVWVQATKCRRDPQGKIKPLVPQWAQFEEDEFLLVGAQRQSPRSSMRSDSEAARLLAPNPAGSIGLDVLCRRVTPQAGGRHLTRARRLSHALGVVVPRRMAGSGVGNESTGEYFDLRPLGPVPY